MPLTKMKEIRELSADELEQRLERLRKEHYELVQKREVGQLDRPHRFRHIRREISQVMAALGEKSKQSVKENKS